MSESLPSTNGTNGRTASGKFAKGNAGGPGNPHAAKVAKLRSAMLRTVTVKDMQAIVLALVTAAKAGDTTAAKILLDRVLGASTALDVLLRIERLESGEEL